MGFPDPPLADEAVVLRPLRMKDVPDIVRACNDPLVPRYVPVVPVPYTEAHGKAFVQRSSRPVDEVNLAITDRETGALLGAVGFSHRKSDHAIAEIGYWLAPEARGRGAATCAVRLLSRWVLTERDVARLQLHTDPENTASQAVALRAGFTREGVLRGAQWRYGDWHDLVSYARLRQDT